MNDMVFQEPATPRAASFRGERAPDAGAGTEGRMPLLTQYMRILIRRRWIILGAIAGCIVYRILWLDRFIVDHARAHSPLLI